MKKQLLILLIALLSIQCSTHRSEPSKERLRLETQYNVPKFSSPEVQDYAYDLLLYFIDLKAAIENGETINPEELKDKVMEFKDKSTSISNKMTSGDVTKLTDWTSRMMLELIPKS